MTNKQLSLEEIKQLDYIELDDFNIQYEYWKKRMWGRGPVIAKLCGISLRKLRVISIGKCKDGYLLASVLKACVTVHEKLVNEVYA